LVQDEIKSYFVEQVLFGKLSKGGKATVDFKDGKVQIQAERK
jgi:ATP-dependent Clp protease ATP-binding subunit ClpA